MGELVPDVAHPSRRAWDAEKISASTPGCCGVPNSLGVAAMEQHLHRRLRGRYAKLTQGIMRPSPTYQAIRCPKLVPKGEPGEELAFRGGPGMPDQRVGIGERVETTVPGVRVMS
jgi:hypothetical protein